MSKSTSQFPPTYNSMVPGGQARRPFPRGNNLLQLKIRSPMNACGAAASIATHNQSVRHLVSTYPNNARIHSLSFSFRSDRFPYACLFPGPSFYQLVCAPSDMI